MLLNPFYYAMSLMETLYGITMQEDQFEETAIVAWNLIGNKRTRLYKYETNVSNCDEGILLPCNADIIEAVTTNWEDWNYSTNDTPNGDINSAYVESYIEHRKLFTDPLYASGKFIKYERVGDRLYFNAPYGRVNVLYKGVILDDTGLPQITDKEATAIATYCAYVYKFKEGLMTNNANIILMASILKQQWNVQVDLARTDHYMSLNDWDEVLDAKTSWNRKLHNRSYKIYR